MNRLPFLCALAGLLTSYSAVAAVIPVDTLVDADVAEGACALREAILAANADAAHNECPAGSGADRIDLTLAGTIVLGADLPEITGSLDLFGPVAGEVVIDGSGSFRQLLAAGDAGIVLRLRRLTLRDGFAVESGGCIAAPDGLGALHLRRVRLEGCESGDDGGAVEGFAISETLVEQSVFLDNRAGASGGALHLWNFGAATITESTFAGNVAGQVSSTGSGGAIVASSVDLELARSTVSGNSAAGSAGGIQISGFSLATIESSTIADNLAGTSGSFGVGGGVWLSGLNVEIDFANSVVAGNVDLTVQGGHADDLSLGTTGGAAVVTSSGFNFLGSNESAETPFPASPAPELPNVHGDFVGTVAAPLAALLGAVAEHGGPTPTREPLPGSPLLDQGSCPGALADQRGFFRLETGLRVVDDGGLANFGDGCDIGAVEHGATDTAGRLHFDDFESENLAAWSAVVP